MPLCALRTPSKKYTFTHCIDMRAQHWAVALRGTLKSSLISIHLGMTLYTTPRFESTPTTLVDKAVFRNLRPTSEKMALLPAAGAVAAPAAVESLVVLTGYLKLHQSFKDEAERKQFLQEFSLKLAQLYGWAQPQIERFVRDMSAWLQQALHQAHITLAQWIHAVQERLPSPPASSKAPRARAPAAGQTRIPTVLEQLLEKDTKTFASADGFKQAKTAFQNVLQAHPQLTKTDLQLLARYLANSYAQKLRTQWESQVKALGQHPQKLDSKRYPAMQATLQAMQGVDAWLKTQGAPGFFGVSASARQVQLQAYFKTPPANNSTHKAPGHTANTGATKRRARMPGSRPAERGWSTLAPPDPYHQKAYKEAREALDRWREAQSRPFSGDIDPADYAPKSELARLIFYAQLPKQKSRRLVNPGTVSSGQNTAGVSSAIKKQLQKLDEKTQKLIKQYLKEPTKIHAKALMRHLHLGQTTPQQWISNWGKLSFNNARMLALIALANRAPIIEKAIARTMNLAIEKINNAQTFAKLALDIEAQAKNLYYPAWVDAKDESPYLQAIANAFLRLGRQKKLSERRGLQFPNQAAHPSMPWQPEYFAELADIVLWLNSRTTEFIEVSQPLPSKKFPSLLQQFPLEVLEHLHNGIYFYSLDSYTLGIRQQQHLAPGVIDIEKSLGDAVMALRVTMSQRGYVPETPSEKEILDRFGQPLNLQRPITVPSSRLAGLGAIPPEHFLATDMRPSKNTFVIGDVHGNADLLLELLRFLAEQIASGRLDPKTVRLILLGDLINKGAASAEVLEIVSLLLQSVENPWVRPQIPQWLQAQGFEQILQQFGQLEIVLIGGNHEELRNYGMHFNPDPNIPIPKYVELVYPLMGRGLPDTVISHLLRYREAFGQEWSWMWAFITDPPILIEVEGEAKWRTQKTGLELDQEEVYKQYAIFRRVWLTALNKIGNLPFISSRLVPAYADNNMLFVHGGPPTNVDDLNALREHLRNGAPLPEHLEKLMLWRRWAGDSNALEDWASVLSDDVQPGQDLSTVWTSIFVGHTMGAGNGKLEVTLSDGRKLVVWGQGTDWGFGLNRLGARLVLTNGDTTVVTVSRYGRKRKIVRKTQNPAELPRLGKVKELQNRR